MNTFSDFQLYKQRQEIISLSKRFISSQSEEEIVKYLTKGLHDLLHYDTMAIYERDQQSGTLQSVIVHERSWRTPSNKWVLPFEAESIHSLIEKGTAELIHDAHHDMRTVYPVLKGGTLEQLMYFPIIVKDQFWGMLILSRSSNQYFSDYEFDLVKCLVSYASLAFNNISLIKKLRERNSCFEGEGVTPDQSHEKAFIDFHIDMKTQQDLIKANSIAEESIREKQEFLTKMSHELKTPINGILGLTNLMLVNSRCKENVHYLKSIKASGEHLLVVINDLLDIASIEAGKLTFDQISFNPSELVQSMQRNVANMAHQKQLEISSTVDVTIPDYVTGDPVRLHQILLNLTSNAIKFTSKGYVALECSVTRKENSMVWLTFQVKDSGSGMSKEKVTMLANLFSHSENNTSASEVGSGLRIVNQLVKLQGGSVSIESILGKGSIISVTIPYKISYEQPQQAIQKEVYDPANVKPFDNVHVLLVEDNPVNQVVAIRTLQLWNIKVTLANNGIEALERLAENKFDLVIMDLQMPLMNGIEATRQIRRSTDESIQFIPIMAMTASDSGELLEQAYQAGMNHHIAKPFKVEDLYQSIQLLLSDDIRNTHDKRATSFEYFNVNYITGICFHNKALELELVTALLQTIPVAMDELTIALHEKDTVRFSEGLSKMRRTLEMIGISSLSSEAEDLEKGIEQVHVSEFRESYSGFIHKLKVLMEEITLFYNQAV